MSRGDWVRLHRKTVLLAAATLLGIFLPLPGLFLAMLFWPAGIHDLDSTAESVTFLLVLFAGSGMVWASLLNLVLPRPKPT